MAPAEQRLLIDIPSTLESLEVRPQGAGAPSAPVVKGLLSGEIRVATRDEARAYLQDFAGSSGVGTASTTSTVAALLDRWRSPVAVHGGSGAAPKLAGESDPDCALFAVGGIAKRALNPDAAKGLGGWADIGAALQFDMPIHCLQLPAPQPSIQSTKTGASAEAPSSAIQQPRYVLLRNQAAQLWTEHRGLILVGGGLGGLMVVMLFGGALLAYKRYSRGVVPVRKPLE